MLYQQQEYLPSIVSERPTDVEQRAKLQRGTLVDQWVLVGRFLGVMAVTGDVITQPTESTQSSLVPYYTHIRNTTTGGVA